MRTVHSVWARSPVGSTLPAALLERKHVRRVLIEPLCIVEPHRRRRLVPRQRQRAGGEAGAPPGDVRPEAASHRDGVVKIHPLRHGRKALFVLDDVHHRAEVDGVVPHAVVVHAVGPGEDIGTGRASAAEEDVYLRGRDARRGEVGQQSRARHRVRVQRVNRDM